MAGLIGSSNSPISSVGILTIVSCSALVLLVATGPTAPLVAFALIVTAIVFAVATISNDNLQDLKTGQLVGAAPSAGRVALLVGVVAGAAVIPFVLNLLGQGFGFAGAPGATARALAAPQATLISALAQGVIGHSLNWKMILIVSRIGVGMVVLDEVLGAIQALSGCLPLAVADRHLSAGCRRFLVPLTIWRDRRALVQPARRRRCAQPGACRAAGNAGRRRA